MEANNLDIIRWLDKNIEKVLLCIFLGVMVVVMSISVFKWPTWWGQGNL